MHLRSRPFALAVPAVLLAIAAVGPTAWADDRDDERSERSPQVVVISLDGARPDLVEDFLEDRVLDRKTGLGRLKTHGVVAKQNITVTPRSPRSPTSRSRRALSPRTTTSPLTHLPSGGGNHRHRHQRVRRANRRLSAEPARTEPHAHGGAALAATSQRRQEGRYRHLAW
jgi:hypothetical protein